MLQRHQLEPKAAIEYIFGGNGKATIVGRHRRYTYEFSPSKDHELTFVSTLIGPENQTDYLYIGFLNRQGKLVAGRKGNPDHPAFHALEWYIRKADEAPEVAEQAEFWHEGICARCGHPLTNPTSIARGLGPKCATKI